MSMFVTTERPRVPQVPATTAATLWVVGGALCLSTTAVLIKLAHLSAEMTSLLRCLLALVVLIPLAGHELRRRGPLTQRAIWMAMLAGVALGIDYAAWTSSIYLVGAGVATVLLNVQVLVLPLLCWALAGERPSLRFLCVVPFMAAGIALVGGIGQTSGAAQAPVRGAVLGVIAGVSYAVYLFVIRSCATESPRLAVQPLAWATGAAAATSALIGGVRGSLDFHGMGLGVWGMMAALAIVGQVIAWLLIQRGSSLIPASSTAGLLLIQPVLTLAASFLLLHESPTVGQLVGALIVMLCVAVANGAVRALPMPRRRSARRAYPQTGALTIV